MSLECRLKSVKITNLRITHKFNNAGSWFVDILFINDQISYQNMASHNPSIPDFLIKWNTCWLCYSLLKELWLTLSTITLTLIIWCPTKASLLSEQGPTTQTFLLNIAEGPLVARRWGLSINIGDLAGMIFNNTQAIPGIKGAIWIMIVYLSVLLISLEGSFYQVKWQIRKQWNLLKTFLFSSQKQRHFSALEEN